MRIDLVAVADLDGSAIIRLDDELVFLRAPYKRGSPIPLDEAEVGEAVLRYGFSAAEAQFSSWTDLIRELERRVRDARAQIGQDLSAIHLTVRALDLAPTEVIEESLDRVEHELLPAMQLEHAEALLLAMLKSANVMHNDIFGVRVGELVNSLRRLQGTRRAWRSRLQDDVFDSLLRSGKMPYADALTQDIYGRGSILVFAS